MLLFTSVIITCLSVVLVQKTPVFLESNFCQESTTPQLGNVPCYKKKNSRHARFKIVKWAKIFCVYNEDRTKSACFQPNPQCCLPHTAGLATYIMIIFLKTEAEQDSEPLLFSHSTLDKFDKGDRLRMWFITLANVQYVSFNCVSLRFV